jgi:hypothetical protein
VEYVYNIMYDPPGPGLQRRQHPQYLPVEVAIMIACCLVTIFVIHPELNGYGGGSDPLSFYEGVGVIIAGVLVGYIGLIFRSI